MTRYRDALPQLGRDLFLTDGGVETTLVFHDGIDLPHFAAFTLLNQPEGRAALHRVFSGYATLATELGTGLILESPTWRANPDWGTKLGYDDAQLAAANADAVTLLDDIRTAMPQTRIVVSGCIGPRGDGYVPAAAMTVPEARAYHRPQIETFAATAADMVCAMTMNYTAEAAGVVLAARDAEQPVAISFTVETDGNLPDGQALAEAIGEVDSITDGYPAYYMINCAHPTHFAEALRTDEPWVARLRGIRANASRLSHAELDAATELDDGDPVDLGRAYADLKRRLGQVTVMGGCCGTDRRHVEQIGRACSPLFQANG